MSATANATSHNLTPLVDLIAQYGDSSNTTWIEEKFSVWRHPPTHAAVGFAQSGDYCIIWGSPLCPREHYPLVVDAFLAWCKHEKLKPIWSCANSDLEHLLVKDLDWRAVMCVQDDILDPSKVDPATNKEVRKHIKAAQKAGFSIVELDAAPQESVRKEIDAVIEAWRAGRKGTQVHATNVVPWDDIEHRKYFYAKDRAGKICALLFIAQVAEGWAIKDCLQTPTAPKNLTEWLITEACHSLGNDGETYLTFGPTPAPSLQGADNMAGSSYKFLSKAYSGIEKSLLGSKRDFRRKFEVEGEPIFVCYPKRGLGRKGISALMKVLTSD